MITQVKRLLGIQDDLQDEVIADIIAITQKRLLVKLPDALVVPSDLEYIVAEVAVKRFRRLGSEGMAKKSLEGLTNEFTLSDFEDYEDDIALYLKPDDDGNASAGTVLFY